MHRVVAEQTIGRPLRQDEHVHHIDGDKKNNTPDNLQVLSASAHAVLHIPDRTAGRRAKLKEAREAAL